MNQKQAVAKLRKILGPKMGWSINSNALTAEERAEQAALSTELRAKEHALKEQLTAMREKLLSDPTYVALRTQWNETKDAADRAWGRSYRKPIDVGTQGAMFFTIKASGDNWEDVLAQLSSRNSEVEG
jgi:hypothetical protein